MKESGVALGTMEFRDQDLREVLNRALRIVVVAILVGIPVIWVAWGLRSMLMFLVGGAIAATGILEWRQLMSAVLVRLDSPRMEDAPEPRPAPRPLGPVVFWFIVRLLAAAGVLYVSLRSLDGKVAALLIGLALAVFALFVEAIRLLRAWSA
jgi:hypothetical protein